MQAVYPAAPAAALRTYSVSSGSRVAPDSVNPEQTSAAVDRVEISDQGRALAGRTTTLADTELFPGIDTSDGISLTELSGLLRENSAELRRDLDEAFERAGIDSTAEVDLTVGYDGSILVSGNHPEKDRIEAVFRDDPELGNRFRQVSALASVIRAGQEAVEFQKTYARDPVAAVEQYAHLFSGSYKPQCHLSYSADSLGIFFTDLYHSGPQPLEY